MCSQPVQLPCRSLRMSIRKPPTVASPEGPSGVCPGASVLSASLLAFSSRSQDGSHSSKCHIRPSAGREETHCTRKHFLSLSLQVKSFPGGPTRRGLTSHLPKPHLMTTHHRKGSWKGKSPTSQPPRSGNPPGKDQEWVCERGRLRATCLGAQSREGQRQEAVAVETGFEEGTGVRPGLTVKVKATRWALGPHASAVPRKTLSLGSRPFTGREPNVTLKAVSAGRVHRCSVASSQLLGSLLHPMVSFLPGVNQPVACGPSSWVLDVRGAVGSPRGASGAL